jgi:tRNA pseudouridine38-40 synthase
MPSFKLTIAYDGTGLVGWQRQASGTSVQGLLEEALGELDGRPVAVAGAGRTDAGVHALGQVASASLERAIDAATLMRAVNARLPLAVRLLAAEEAPAAFHARFDARAKTYRYRIWNTDVISPFERAYVWHIPGPTLDVGAMAEGARHIEGRRDFSAFAGTGADTATTVREIFSSAMREMRDPAGPAPGGAVIAYDVTGDGFLRHMVRTIVGTLVEVGRGRRQPDWVAEVIASGRREDAGRTAPAEGLFLMNVSYNQGLPVKDPHVA